MHFETLKIAESTNTLTVTLHRPAERNSINATLLREIKQLLDIADNDPDCRFIIFQGENNIFCTGMDFQELVHSHADNMSHGVFSADYMTLLRRLTTTSKIIISLLDGQVLAGGIGLAAASDLVLSTSRTQLGLSEALWGLLPACVMPFLIRRIGFQKAYYLTLTTKTVTATEAFAMGLIDELTEDLDENLRRLIVRLTRISQDTVTDLKAYFRKMWIITDAMEEMAVSELNRLTSSHKVQENIKNFITKQQFPWQS